ncbi:hypothetical protein FQN50_006539 [Emmonsiellopsis sp. PD_5]|nr:hypothetical protein FQN50_006539 [Emmonsiellopsis sp. PD_5]
MALEVLYQNAHFANYVEGMHDPKEYQTVELLENIFNKVIFKDKDDVFVNSQQPPGMHSNKACDIVIKYIESGSFKTKILCFVECKRSKKTKPYDLREVEKQARQYSEEYLVSEPGLDFVYVCTACGAHLRLWKYQRGGKALQGFWGSYSPAAWEEYKDVGIAADAENILLSFDRMLAMGPQLREGQDMDGYGSVHDRKGKQPPHQGIGGSHHQASATPREVNATVYESHGQQAVAFNLDGEQEITWLSDWSTAQTSDGRPLLFLKSHNGLKLYAIDGPQEDSPSFGDRFLWDCDHPISASNVLTAETYYANPRDPVRETLAWTPVRHLPLHSAQSVLYGITLFCSPAGGITGMGAHFRSDRHSNERKVHWTGRQTGWSRCTGMMITYTHGAVEILGQWYESLPSKQTIIYEAKNDKPFEKLHFKMSYEDGHTLLREVTLFPPSNGFNGTVKDISYGVSALSVLGS